MFVLALRPVGTHFPKETQVQSTFYEADSITGIILRRIGGAWSIGFCQSCYLHTLSPNSDVIVTEYVACYS